MPSVVLTAMLDELLPAHFVEVSDPLLSNRVFLLVLVADQSAIKRLGARGDAEPGRSPSVRVSTGQLKRSFGALRSVHSSADRSRIAKPA
jgi:hypothetical protein